MDRRNGKKTKINVETQYGVFDVVIEKDGRDYLVSVPKYPEVVTFGTSFAHAKHMAKEAIEVSIEGDILMRAERTGDIKLVRTPVRLA
jgi:predicted RNase H-like HicB family nuclease